MKLSIIYIYISTIYIIGIWYIYIHILYIYNIHNWHKLIYRIHVSVFPKHICMCITVSASRLCMLWNESRTGTYCINIWIHVCTCTNIHTWYDQRYTWYTSVVSYENIWYIYDTYMHIMCLTRLFLLIQPWFILIPGSPVDQPPPSHLDWKRIWRSRNPKIDSKVGNLEVYGNVWKYEVNIIYNGPFNTFPLFSGGVLKRYYTIPPAFNSTFWQNQPQGLVCPFSHQPATPR